MQYSKSLRSVLERADHVWNAYLHQDANKLELIQKGANQLLYERVKLSYADKLEIMYKTLW